jgi:hypothetical protein
LRADGAAFFPLLMHDPGALIKLYARFIRYGLRKGVNMPLAVMIGVYELILQRVLPNCVQAPPVAERVFLQIANASSSGNTYLFNFLNGMSKQLDKPMEASDALYKAIHQGLESGDKDFANLAMITCLVTHNGDLYALKELLRYYAAHMRQNANAKTLDLVRIASGYVAALQDESLTDGFVAIPQALDSDSEQRKRIQKAIRAQLRRMKSWRGFLGNRTSAYLLMKAEWERIAGSKVGALREYTAAIGQARAEKYVPVHGNRRRI